jgi:hypothetical protein
MRKYRPQLFFAGAVVIGLITALLVMGKLRDVDMRHVAPGKWSWPKPILHGGRN